MRVNTGLLGWGVFLIALGAVPLAVRAGYLDEATVRRAFELWPLILVGIGLGLLLKRTKAAAFGGLVVALTFGLMGGAVLATGLSGAFAGCGWGFGGGSGTPFETRAGTFGAEADVNLGLNCGEMTVSPQAGSGWTVAGSDGQGVGPDIESAPDLLRVRSPETPGWGAVRGGQRWQVSLPTDPVLGLSVAVNAGSARIDLAGVHVTETNVAVNAGDARIDLSGSIGVATVDASANAGSVGLTLPAADITGGVAANAGSVELCVPDGVGLRFTWNDNPLSANNFDDHGLVRSGNTWTSPEFDTAETQIVLTTSANAGSITLNPENGCD